MVRISAGIAIALGLMAPASQEIPASLARDGVECVPIVTQSPVDKSSGRVEVVEAFSYACAHCFRFEPHIAAWLKNKAGNIDFVRVHVPGRGLNGSYARLYYTLKALGRLDLHEAVFTSIFNDARPLSAQSEEEAFKVQLAFAVEHGIDANAFTETYRSLAVSHDIQQARDLLRAYQVDATPRFIVDSRFRISMNKPDSQAAVMSFIDDIAAYLQ